MSTGNNTAETVIISLTLTLFALILISFSHQEKVRQSKELYNRSPETMMTEAMPEELKAFAMYLRSLDFQDEPDYAFLLTRLDQLLQRIGTQVGNILRSWHPYWSQLGYQQ
jgi:predicted lysophospholipase L1 biosynthesis ABC-type transport system permease subunit